MTPGRAAILKVLETYRSLNYGLSRLEVQKLAYFLQEAGEPLRLNFVKAEYGPYADNLRHALNNMEGHFIQGVGDGVVESDIQPIGDATAEAAVFLMSHDQGDLAERVARVERLIDGYQSPYGMELLATVHWVATRSPHARTLDDAIVAVVAWNDRKKTLMQPGHLAAAWQRLSAEGWIDEAQEQRDTRQEIANAYH